MTEETVLGGIVGCLQAAADYDRNVQLGPVALLWPDERRQWAAVVDRIGQWLPVVTLDDYAPDARRGPAYWIRCVVAGTIPVDLPTGPSVPIVYLPGVGKASLRAADHCPPDLAPIAELQFRGQWFAHPKGRDWTVSALLSNQARGLAVPVADDEATKRALAAALPTLLDEPIDRLRQIGLDADYLNDLVEPDPVFRLLKWIDDPRGFRERVDANEWATFSQRCERELELNPETAGEVSAARMLGLREGPWARIWQRFRDGPDRFPGVVEALRKARPEELIVDRDAWPQENEEAEEALRGHLEELSGLGAEEARDRLRVLDEEHAWRRSTVWADLGWAQLAFALEHLTRLAELTATPLSGEDVARLVTAYENDGSRADDAVVRALEAAPEVRDRRVTAATIKAIYRPWVDAGARSLQQLVAAGGYAATGPSVPAAGTVTLFVDGLRLDLGRRLAERLEEAGTKVTLTTSLAALPTVTQAAKPAIAPVGPDALGPGSGLGPADAASKADASIAVLRRLIEANGVQVLRRDEPGDPSRPAFAEAGDIDGRGHDQGAGMVDGFDAELRQIAMRARELLDAGWERIEVVTDHGWLLMPGGMEKVDLPAATVVKKKGRCARLKEGARVDCPTVSWHWDPEVRIALSVGATCFEVNREYEHGGVSPAECVVPRLLVEAGDGPAGAAEFTSVRWLGLQCRVEVEGLGEAATLDLRLQPSDAASSIAERSKETSGAGRVSLLVPDEKHEGETARLVLIGAEGRILAQREVVIGGDR